jgi:hypothetical protein
MDIDMNKFVGSFVIDRWNRKFNWVRRINRVTKTQLVSDTQRVSDYEADDKEDYTYYYFKKFAKRFKAVDAGVKFDVVDSTGLNNALLSKKSFKELFQTDVDEIQNKQEFIDYVVDDHKKRHEEYSKYSNTRFKALSEKEIKNEIDRNGYIGHRQFEIYQIIKDLYLSSFGREFNEDELNTLEMFLIDYETMKKMENDRKYLSYTPIFEYLSKLFEKPVYRLGDSMASEFIKEHNTYSELSKNQNFMQVTHFGNDAEHISDSEDSNNCTIGFWVFDECVVWQDAGGRGTW